MKQLEKSIISDKKISRYGLLLVLRAATVQNIYISSILFTELKQDNDLNEKLYVIYIV